MLLPGNRRDDLGFTEKWLVPKPSSLFPPNGPPASPQVIFSAASSPAAAGILTRADADEASLAYDYVAARITLRVNSALTATGLTAASSRALADTGISCNVIAGRAHDHLFVDWDHRTAALTLLRGL